MKGFSLLELLITVTVLGILVAVALPSYQNYALRSKRTEAQIALMTVSQELEKFRTLNNSYEGATLGSGSTAIYPAKTENGYYLLSLSTLGAGTYKVTATPSGSQAKDVCGSLSINQAGERSVSGGSVTDIATCWK